MCILKAGFSNLNDGWPKYKEKIPAVTDFNQNVKTTCNPRLKLAELKNIHQKGTKKLVKDELCMKPANTAILKLQIFSRRYHFRLRILL